ncbi:MAG: TraB/GumN family protein [Paracoccaceae bacterium]
MLKYFNHFALIAFCLLAPGSVGAQSPVAQITCAGTDLIAAMPEADRTALYARTNAVPYPEGNHWRATKGSQTIDIIGTFHIYDQRMDAPVKRLEPLIAAADAIYLEATQLEVKKLQDEVARNSDLLFTKGPTLPERLSAEEWQALSEAVTARGIPPFMASKFQPWYLSMMLSIPPCAMSAMTQGSSGVDSLIEKAASTAGVQTHALEPYDTIFTVFGRFTPDQQLDMIRAALLSADGAGDSFYTMFDAYFREQHRLIWDFGLDLALASAPDKDAVLKDLALMEKSLITDRNSNWIKVIEAAKGDHLLVAVGAGHLAGDGGLLKLLENAGYTLTRQEF